MCAASRRQLDHWAGNARGRLALILLLDQCPRNVYRGQVDAFASDAHALRLALTGIDAGLDRRLGFFERSIFYLPLEHAEDAAIQARSVAAFTALAADASPALRPAAEEFLDYARPLVGHLPRVGSFVELNK